MTKSQIPRNDQGPRTRDRSTGHWGLGVGHSLGFGHGDLVIPSDRRQFFRRTGLGLGAAALAALLHEDTASAAPAPHFPAKAKRVIYLHMIGAPSHLDLFDPKPELNRRDGEPCPESLL